MPYAKQEWIDSVTPVDAARMTHIEDGIYSGTVVVSDTPPATPTDGDLWCLPADAANGVNWTFRYNAASSSPYKWEFIGGSPLSASIPTAENIPANTAPTVDLTTIGPSVTLPRAGDYDFLYSLIGTAAAPTGAQPWSGAYPTTAANVRVGTLEAIVAVIANASCQGTISDRVAGIGAGLVKLRYYNFNGAARSLQARLLQALPVRVS